MNDMNDMNEMPICDRRVQAYFQKNGPFKKPPLSNYLSPECVDSICTSSKGICDTQMNSGDEWWQKDKNSCLTCIAGTTPAPAGGVEPIASLMRHTINMRAFNSKGNPCLKELQAYEKEDPGSFFPLTARAIGNTCTNYACAQTLDSICHEEKIQGPKTCAWCVGNDPDHARLAQNAGCAQKDIDAWCQSSTPHVQTHEGFSTCNLYNKVDHCDDYAGGWAMQSGDAGKAQAQASCNGLYGDPLIGYNHRCNKEVTRVEHCPDPYPSPCVYQWACGNGDRC